MAVSGSVEPSDAIEVAFQIPGRVLRVPVEEGAAVSRGQLLAELDPADYKLAVDAAVAQVAGARAVYEKALAGARTQELDRARAAYDRAAAEHARMKILFERKSLAPNDYEKVQAAYLAAKAQFEEAREGARKEDISAAAAALEQARAGEAIARKRLDDTRLKAPIAGLVARRLVDEAETAAAGMPVFSIAALDVVKVRVGVPEADIALVRLGLKAEVTAPALPGRVFTGVVSLVGVAAEPSSRTFTVKIAVPNQGRLLKAGMIAEARIRTNATVALITLPGETIVRDPQGVPHVYIYYPEQGRVHARRVELGGVYGQEIAIQRGLEKTDRVVVAGQHRLREGAAAIEERAQ